MLSVRGCVLLLSDNRVSFLFLSFWATSSEFYCWPTAVSSFKTSILWVSTTSCPCYRAFQEIQFSLVLYWPSSIFQNNKKIKLSVGPEVSKTQKPSEFSSSLSSFQTAGSWLPTCKTNVDHYTGLGGKTRYCSLASCLRISIRVNDNTDGKWHASFKKTLASSF